MIEKINDIILDDTHYSGSDMYSDGDIEDEMLDLVMHYEEAELNALIRDRFSWPLLYHFSHIRQNIVTWLPIRKDQSVLEIGSGCGAVTGGLARMADHVTCIELSKKRSLINANRNRAYGNIEIKVGNFSDIEPNLTEKYDYITLIGVFEYAESYIQSDAPYHDFLERIKKHLKPDGKIVIAIENRLGMKYLAGCREDHTGLVGEGLDHYSHTEGVRTFDKGELQDIFEKTGFADARFYYPYPDYKLPLEIYSDKWLPTKGQLTQNVNNLDRSRLYFFDENDAFDKAVEWGIFSELSNSYEVILTNPSDRNEKTGDEPEIVYTRFSNDRRREYAIQTQILKDASGIGYVRKLPLTDEAEAHIERVYANEKLLDSAFSGTRFSANRTEKLPGTEKERYFEFVKGKTLEKELDDLLFSGNTEGFFALYDSFVAEIKKLSSSIVDIDLIPSNIIIKDDIWHVIDYEWVYDVKEFPVAGFSVDFLIYRSLFYYWDVSEKRKDILKKGDFYGHFGMTEEEIRTYMETEEAFQEVLNQDYYKLMTAKYAYHKDIWEVNQFMAEYPPDVCRTLALREEEIAQQKEYIEGLQENIRLLKQAVETMENSTSWRITKPMRKLKNVIKGEPG